MAALRESVANERPSQRSPAAWEQATGLAWEGRRFARLASEQMAIDVHDDGVLTGFLTDVRRAPHRLSKKGDLPFRRQFF